MANSQEFCVRHVANHVIITWYSCDLAHPDHESLPLISHQLSYRFCHKPVASAVNNHVFSCDKHKFAMYP